MSVKVPANPVDRAKRDDGERQTQARDELTGEEHSRYLKVIVVHSLGLRHLVPALIAGFHGISAVARVRVAAFN